MPVRTTFFVWTQTGTRHRLGLVWILQIRPGPSSMVEFPIQIIERGPRGDKLPISKG